MPSILVITGHPRLPSYCSALADAYASGALEAGADVDRIDVGSLSFDPARDVDYWNEGWTTDQLEPDLLDAMNRIRRADRITFVYPLWWGFMPTLLKGFIDRTFSIPGFGADYDERGVPIGLLKPRRATLIVTMDAPVWWERYVKRNRGLGVMRSSILGLCGVKTDRVLQLGPMFGSTSEHRAGWLLRAGAAGLRDAG